MPSRHSTRGRAAALVLIALVAVIGAESRGAAQQRPAPAPGAVSDAPAAKWLFTPSIVLATSWDDNVLLRDEGDGSTGDVLNAVNPRARIDYNGRHTHLSGDYDGAFLLYRELNALNSYDQHASVAFDRALTRRVKVFARNTAALLPTTDAVEFVGVPFVRAGSKIDELRGGVSFDFTRRTRITGAYSAEWVAFHNSPDVSTLLLLGGHSQGGDATFRHQQTRRIALTADYNVQFGVVTGLPTTFNLQDVVGGIEYQITEGTVVSGGGGISHVNVSGFGPSRTGPALRAGLAHQLRRGGFDVSYSRSFVPSYGFGGTTENEDLTARVRGPIARRFFAQGSFAWRRNEPLEALFANQRLVSLWLEGTVGYSATPWMRVEGFYSRVRQTIDRPGGLLTRNRIGAQLVIAQPMRIQ